MAIDVHVHVESDSRGRLSLPYEFAEAPAKYFRGRHSRPGTRAPGTHAAGSRTADPRTAGPSAEDGRPGVRPEGQMNG